MKRTAKNDAAHIRRFAKRGLTMVEITATVVSLVLLTLWLVPAAAGVRSGSKASRCLGNLAQIGFANLIYSAQDPAGMALPVHRRQNTQCPGLPAGQLCSEPIYVGAYDWGGKSGVGRDRFLTGISGDPLNSRYGTKAGFGPATRPLNQIIYGDKLRDHNASLFNPTGAKEDTQLNLDVYRCPSDTGQTGMHCSPFQLQSLTSYDYFGTSYNANIFMTGSSDGSVFSNSPYLRPMSRVPNPSATLAYMENNGRFAWAASPELSECMFIGDGRGFPGKAKGWHGKDWTFNAAFIDGHADTIYMRGYRNTLVFPDDDGIQNRFRCIIIRGEGWQIDTLPDQRIPTNLASGFGRPSYEDCLSTPPD